MRTPLTIGAEIMLHEIDSNREIRFRITDMIGMGASCFVYTAVFTDAEGNLFSVRLKEFYPISPDITRDETKLVVLEESKKKYKEMLSCFTSGYQKQLEFRQNPEQMNSISNIQGIYTGNNTRYIAMSCNTGACLTNSQDYDVIEIFRIILAVTVQIQNFHDSGYLYLDLKPSNIFLYPETFDMVMLFDFDSVISKKEVIQHAEWLSFTEEWAAPELCQKQIRKIDERADIYAIGALLLFLLFKRKPGFSDRQRFADWSEEIRCSVLAEEPPETQRLVTELLRKTLATNVDSRFQDCGELLDKIESYLNERLVPKPYLKSYLPMGANFFCGRSTEIKEIHEVLRHQARFVVLHGIGGIGKSELAKHYALTYISEYDASVFVRFRKNIIHTIISDTNFPIVHCNRSEDEDDTTYFERKLKILREICTSRHLLILDNFDTEECENLDVLMGLPCDILITSRVDYSDVFCQYDIDVLQNPDDLFRLVTYYYKENMDDENIQAVKDIISAVQAHTMALELISKHMQTLGIIPIKMNQMLMQNGITSSNDGKVRNVKDGSMKSKAAYAHIAALFSILGISEEMKQVLRYAALFGPNMIDREFFVDACELTAEQNQALISAIACGWIQMITLSSAIAVTLHPLISDVLCQELKPDIDHCADFVLFAAVTAGDIQDFEWEQRNLHISWLDHVAHNICGNSTKITFLLDNMNMLYMAEEDFENAQWCNLRIVNMIYDLHEEENFPRQLLNSYLFLKTLASLTGHPEQEQIYIEKIKELGSVEALEHLASEQCREEMEKGNYTTAKLAALERLQIALQTEDGRRIAKAYHQLGEVECGAEHEDMAMNALAKAVEYIENYLVDFSAESEQNLAMIYNDAGNIHTDAGNYDAALGYYQKELELHLKEHGEVSGYVQDVWLAISLVYHQMGESKKQRESLKKCLYISEHVYGKLHHETTYYYEMLYKQYLKEWQESQEESWLEACAELIQNLISANEALYGEESLEVAKWYMEYSDLLWLMDDEEKCYAYMERAFQVYRILLDEENEDWIDLYCRASNSCLYFGDNEQSLNYLEKAIWLCELYEDIETLEKLTAYLEDTFGV